MIFRVLVFLAASVAACWPALASQDKSPPPAPAAAKPAAPAVKEYVGLETCAGCHEDIANALKKNPHWILEVNKRSGWEGKACEACHGPGSLHAETMNPADIRNPQHMSPGAVDALCLKCHKNQPTPVGRLQSGHARNAVPCTSCHNMHKSGAERSQVQLSTVNGVNQKCASCHSDVWAWFQRPYHHKLPEGAMSCTGCHNPHASYMSNRNTRMANATDPGCLKCHSDKRGPFVFDHAPVKNEPCSACHEPHGSVNPRMLARATVPPLCLECHSNLQSPSKAGTIGGVAPGSHDMRSPVYQNCTVCHQKIHGSNVSKGLLR
jgi:DmsE family decaheme c-type cytochrome